MMAKNERPNFQLVTAEDTVCLDHSIEYLKDQDFLKKESLINTMEIYIKLLHFIV